MAYDFGSQTLGIKNPFKTEGALRTWCLNAIVSGLRCFHSAGNI